MKAVNTDKKLIEELVSKGVEKIYPSKKILIDELKSGKKLKLYCGFDPSAPSLHIGHAIILNKLSQFQKLGHEVIFLIGSFTGMIGDPTDKKSARKQLTREEVLENAKNYKKQASSFLNFTGDNPVKVLYNSDWSDKLTFADLIDIASNFTYQQIIQRDMFQARIRNSVTNYPFICYPTSETKRSQSASENKKDDNHGTEKEVLEASYDYNISSPEEKDKPIYLHEFLYPLAQAYDSLYMNVDLEVGGNDQMFNMMCGRDLMKAKTGKEKFVVTLKLLADDKGVKMGKSEGNAVFLDNDAKDMYGKIMSWPDDLIIKSFELCTFFSLEETKEMERSLSNKKINPRDLKMKLAFEITKTIRGEKEAKKAQESFVSTVQKKVLPDDIEELSLEKEKIQLDELLIKTSLAKSKSEARRLITQGAIKIINDNSTEVCSDPKSEISVKANLIVQRGKRQFVKIK